jgi:8-oxo-dGTP diphosphatase
MLTNSQSLIQFEVRVLLFSLRANRLQVLLDRPEAEASTPWELPGSEIEASQSLDETASHCLTRFSGLKEAYLEQLYTYGDPLRAGGRRVVAVVYFAVIPTGTRPIQVKDDAAARWFPVEELPCLALDYAEVVRYGLRRLRYKLEYTAVGFQLLPETFSLSELQQTYELILGEKLDKRNFRRRILDADIIEPTQQQRSGEGRPAMLYRFRPGAVAEVKARRLFP